MKRVQRLRLDRGWTIERCRCHVHPSDSSNPSNLVELHIYGARV
jgi:hypothetical protein